MGLRSFTKSDPVPDYLEKDYIWADTNFPELVRQFPEEWVAVSDGKVIAHGAHPDQVSSDAYRLAKHPHIAFLFIERRLRLY